ncbi:transglutaminase domain-containing protein [Paenibacillus soyae]|uniref:Transglutaminase-like domain-containing protein n=1 Tax=Paenibacillus soyae TaxID=2969249 RepID=A0A9X2MTT9_9BACL|nr:transglutaminase domain-containing protein [Paenibacillus soyae]MCR2803637.1 hypothetical protein [Paenibacillus soyae]
MFSRNKKWFRSIVFAVLAAFSFTYVLPTQIFAAEKRMEYALEQWKTQGIQPLSEPVQQETANTELQNLMLQLDQAYQALDEHVTKQDLKQLKETLKQLDQELKEAGKRVEQEFKEHGVKLNKLKAANGLARNDAFQAEFMQQYGELQSIMKELRQMVSKGQSFKHLDASDIQEKLLQLKQLMSPERPEASIGTELPHRDVTREPAEPITGNGGSAAFMAASADAQTLLSLPYVPEAADLEATKETRMTPELESKAQEIGSNPVKLYEYVRNHIDFVPYYGSRKGASGALLEQSGNDMDQASLLISLLRYHDIPARYVKGVVDFPAARVQNWVDAETPEAAIRTLGALGIPVTGIVSQGKLSEIRMEHVWVEAYVPYGDGRGLPGTAGDSIWVPLDPSFKQYKYTTGLDFEEIGGWDEQNFQNMLLTGERSGDLLSTTNLDLLGYQDKVGASMDAIQAYIEEHQLENGQIEALIGGKEIIPQQLRALPLSLPAKLVEVQEEFREVTDTDSDRVTFAISGANPFGLSFSSAPDFVYEASAVDLYGKKITLSWIPATKEDEAIIASYGGLFQTPAYLVKVKPVLYMDGEAVATGTAVGLAYQQQFTMTMHAPGHAPQKIVNPVTAGGFYAVVLNYGHMSSSQLSQIQESLDQIKGSVTEQTMYTNEALGEILHAAGSSYFAQVDVNDAIMSARLKVNVNPMLRELMTGYNVSVGYMFMSPVQISEGGLYIDVDHNVYSVVSKNGDKQSQKAFMLGSGVYASAMEHAIYEQILNLPSVSAIRILEEANERAVPIYTVSKSNIATVLPKLQVSSMVKSDITNAVNQGRIAIIPEHNIQFYDWNGTGYIVLDPNTGAAGYMLSGGTAGGSSALAVGLAALVAIIDLVLMILSTAALLAAGTLVGGILGLVMLALTISFAIQIMDLMMQYYLYGDSEAGQALITEAIIGILAAIGGGILAKVLPGLAKFADDAIQAIKNLLKNTDPVERIARDYGDDFLDDVLRNSGTDSVDDVVKAIDDLQKAGASKELIDDVGSQYGKEGLDRVRDLLNKGLDESQIRQILDSKIGLDDAVKLADNGIHPSQYDQFGIKDSTEAAEAAKQLDNGFSAADLRSLAGEKIYPSDFDALDIKTPADAAAIVNALQNGTAQGLSFSTGRGGEAFLRALAGVDKTPGTTQFYRQISDPALGNRFIDVYDAASKTAYESKVGYMTLTDSIREQVLKDAWLLKNDPNTVQHVEWHFFTSGVTGRAGPSGPLEQFLTSNGITVVKHY